MIGKSVARRNPGWWYPYIFVGGFVVVAAVNGVMMTSAIRTFSGLETRQPYEEGLGYNKVLGMAQAQAALGWHVDAQMLPKAGAGHQADVVVTFADRDGKPLTGMSVKAQIIRPTVAGYDRSVTLAEQGEGRYAAPVDLPLPGQWELHLTATGGQASYQLDKRFLLP